jgi:hypothetical protein
MPITIDTTIAAIFTLCVMTFLIRDNFIFKATEHLVIGFMAAHIIITNVWALNTHVQTSIISGKNPLLIVAFGLGLLLFMKFSNKMFWLARYPIAFMVGLGTALAMTREIRTNFIGQIQGTMVPIGQSDLYGTFTSVLVIVGVICSVTYFIFTREHKGVYGYFPNLGRYVLMSYFGAAYVLEAIAFNGFFLGRIDFLLRDWLGII